MRPSERWRRLARAGWYVCAALASGIVLLSIIANANAVGEYLPSRLGGPEPARLLNAVYIASFLAYTTAVLTSLVLAGVLFVKRPADGMALFSAYFLLVYGVVEAGPLASLEFFWPGATTLAWSVLQPILFVPLLIAFLSIFPNGRFVPAWTRRLVGLALLYVPFDQLLGQAEAWIEPDLPSIVRALIWFALAFTGLYAQVYRYRSASSPAERQQTKWVVYGVTLTLLFMFVMTFWSLWFGPLPPEAARAWLAPVGHLGWSLAIVALPVALTFAVMRYRLFDADLVINRTLVYGALTASAVAIYVLSVGVLSAAFQSLATPLVALLATGVIAVLFQPLRARLQRAANRLVYGERDDPLAILSRLGKDLEAALPPDQLLSKLVQTIAQTLKLPFVGIAVEGSDSHRLAAQFGRPVKEALVFPLAFQGETVGELRAATRGPHESFTPAEMRLLWNLARQAGPVAHAIQLAQDLRQSRARLVTAREEERRRLRRDLHDGLGPVLASQGLKIAAASHLLETDPGRARRILDEIASQNEATVAEIRRLIYALRPPELDELGLVGAVYEYAKGLNGNSPGGARFKINFQPPEKAFNRLPVAVEIAAYRIAAEGLANVARHARARNCWVSFAVEERGGGRTVRLVIADDGVGLPPGHRAGVGLSSMRERAAEVGGAFSIESTGASGTRLVARFPLMV